MAKKIAVILSGCGVYDGVEIHEAVLTLLALDEAGATARCFAPNIEQMHVIDHLRGDVMTERRNVLLESARVARGAVQDLAEYRSAEYDGLILPGGFGAAKNLSSYATAGADCEVQEDVARAVLSTHEAGKPVAALCISPTILAKLIPGAKLTLGAAGDDSAAAERMGASHTVCTHGEIVIDEARRIVTSPCYMLDATITQVAAGARNAVRALLEMA